MWFAPIIWIIWIIIIIANILKEKKKEESEEYVFEKAKTLKSKNSEKSYKIKERKFKKEEFKKEPKPTIEKKEEVVIKKSKPKIIDLSSKDKVKEAIILSEILKRPKAFKYIKFNFYR